MTPTPDAVSPAYRTAVAFIAARWRGDGDAMVDLWNLGVEEDPKTFAEALATLPLLVADRIAKSANVTIEWDSYFDNVLRAMAAEDN